MKERMITVPESVYESEKKMRFFGASPLEIYRNKFDIFIGISISNKTIDLGMAFNYLKWAVRNTGGKVAVAIADELNIVNYKIFDKYGEKKSINRAKRVGDSFEEIFRKAIKKLSLKDQSKVKIYRWASIKKSANYIEIKDFLFEEYKQNPEFKSAILYFVKKYMRKKGKIITDSKKIDELASYILGELPTLLQGIYLDGVNYNLCIYPTYFASGMSQFVMDIHNEELDVGKKLKKLIKNKAVLVEAWLD